MSNIILGKVWKLRLGDATRKLVAVCMADAANHEGHCWPSLKALAELCEIHVDSVRRHLRALEEMGMIEREDRFTRGRQTSNGYTFNDATLALMIGLHECKGEACMGATLPPCTGATPILEPSLGTITQTPTGAGNDLFGTIPQATPKPGRVSKVKLSKDDRLAAAAIRESQVVTLLEAYPKSSTAPHIAARIIGAKLRKYPLETLLAAVRSYAEAKRGTEARFIKSPENYFRDDCFLIAQNVPDVGKIQTGPPVLSAAERRALDGGSATK